MSAEDFAIVIESILQVAIFGGLVYGANLAITDKRFRNSTKIAIFLINVAFATMGPLVLASISDAEAENIAAGSAIIFIAAGLVTLLLFDDVRVRIRHVFPVRPDGAVDPPSQSTPTNDMLGYYTILTDGEALRFATTEGITTSSGQYTLQHTQAAAGSSATKTELLGFDPHNMVHALALILSIWVLGFQIADFVAGGGLAGIAEDIEVSGALLFANFLPFLVLSLLGVGLYSRRSLSEVLARLGLTPPTLVDVGAGVAAAIGLFVMQIVMAGIWFTIVGESTFEEQTQASEAIGASINTIWLVLGVATAAAIGEEIAFRGALQPIFGLWWTAAFFTLIHMQYTLTPAALIIFAVAVAFGFMRRHFTLYTCIVAHFIYNFIPLLINLS